eukprot:jgi/Ulvmu1/11032/UM007_0212.1
MPAVPRSINADHVCMLLLLHSALLQEDEASPGCFHTAMLSLASMLLAVASISSASARSIDILNPRHERGQDTAHSRGLQEVEQDQRKGTITTVASFKDLKKAWTDGAAHIEVTSHLDATNFPLVEAEVNNEVFQHLLPMQLPTTRSVRGNCSEPPTDEFLQSITGAAMLPVKPGQCLILANEHVVPLAAGALWWDNMYLRFAGMPPTEFAGESSRRSTAPMLFHSHGGRAWVTNTTIQGDGSSPCGGIVIYPNAALQFVDVTVHSMVSTHDVTASKLPPVYVRASSASFLRCRFAQNSVPVGVPLVGANEPGSAPEGSADDPGAALRFQECTFTGNNETMRIQAYSGVDVFSDNVTEVNFRPEQGHSMGPATPVPQLSMGDTRKDLTFLHFASDPDFAIIQEELEAIHLGLPLPPSELIFEETDGDSFGTDGSADGLEASAEAAAPPPPDDDNGGLSPAAVGGIVAAAVLVAAVSLGLALWMARTRIEKPAADLTSSSRRSYLMGADYEKSEEGESVREFVKTALGRAAPRRKSSGHVGSMGSGVSSAQSIAASSHGRSDAQLAAVACPAHHVHPSHLPHCCSHGARSLAGSSPGMLAPAERCRSAGGSVSSSSHTGRSQHSSVHGRRTPHKSPAHRGHSPMCCGSAGAAPGWDWSASGANGVVHAALQQQQYEDGVPHCQGAVFEDAMAPVAEVEPRLSSFGWKSEGTRGSRRSRSESRWQNGFRGPQHHSSHSARTGSSRDDGRSDSDDMWGTAADLSVQSKTNNTPSTATPSAGVFPAGQRSPAAASGSARSARSGRGGTLPPSPQQLSPPPVAQRNVLADSSALIPAGGPRGGAASSGGVGEDSGSEQHTRILPSPCADPDGPYARPSPDIIMRGMSTASAEEMAAAMEHGGGMEPVGPPVPGASVDDRLNRLCRQLDTLMRHKIPVLGEYMLLGMDARRQGGQGVVQFARSLADGHEHALKFFVSPNAFDRERRLYGDPTLGVLLPRLGRVCPNDDGAITDAFGEPLPPFIVMEKGEALDEWSRRAKPDLFQSVAMLANIAKRLEYLHSHGFVHRDLKPSNVMWLPRENRWTVIDFGCAARIGRPASISFSLRYAAPEVIEALTLGAREMTPHPSLDSWSLGVLAFELLTGAPAFDLLQEGPAEVAAQLRGARELPWEGGRAIDGGYMSTLRAMRHPVLRLLHRDAGGRLSLEAFCNMCDDIFATRTMHAADGSDAMDEMQDTITRS